MPSTVRIRIDGHVSSLLLLAVLAVTELRISQHAAGRQSEQPFVLADPSVISGITLTSDLDRDGVQDMVLMSPSVRVFHGNGDGTFREVQTFSPAGVWPALADLNGDLYPGSGVDDRDESQHRQGEAQQSGWHFRAGALDLGEWPFHASPRRER